jgi:hypothetical protein
MNRDVASGRLLARQRPTHAASTAAVAPCPGSVDRSSARPRPFLRRRRRKPPPAPSKEATRGTEGAPPAHVLRRGGRCTVRRSRYRQLRTLSLGLTMRPLRGRCLTAGGSAGHARARCTRPRVTHGYLIDRSAVAESTAPRSRNQPLDGRGTDRYIHRRAISRSPEARTKVNWGIYWRFRPSLPRHSICCHDQCSNPS